VGAVDVAVGHPQRHQDLHHHRVAVGASDLRRAGGYLSRQGPATLRWALFEAAHNASRSGSPDHAYYTAVKDRHDGKLAAISVARQFARRCYHLLRYMDPTSSTPPQPDRCRRRRRRPPTPTSRVSAAVCSRRARARQPSGWTAL
jgi:hypothetical protein